MHGIDWAVDSIDFQSYYDRDYELTASLYGKFNSPIGYVGYDEIWGDLKKQLRDVTMPTIKRVIFNPPATIIIWNDNTKSIVKCQNGEEYDPEKGFVMAYLKKLLGNDNTFNKEIKKWVKWEGEK